jgi:putative acetyltransferase
MIRPATNQDAADITQLVFDVLHDYGLKPDPETTDADLADIESHYHQRGGCFDVLLNENKIIIGTVGLFPMKDGRCELRKMYLHRDERGKGHGKRLLEHALRRAAELGFCEVVLETAFVLKEAIALYESYGFTPCELDHLSERCDQAYHKKIGERDVE